MPSSPVSNIRSMAITARDILSSFDSDKLPNELLREGLFENIDREYGQSRQRPEQPPADRTITMDLQGTLFQHAAHDPAFFRELRKIQTDSSCQRLFYEKIDRRIRQSFSKYDYFRHRVVIERRALDAEEDSQFHAIPSDLRNFLDAVREDLQLRQYPGTHEKAARTVLIALEGVCARNEDIVQSRAARGHPARKLNLFEALIGIGSNGFGIEILEELDDGTLGGNPDLHAQLIAVNGSLIANSAPSAYLQRVNQLR